MHVGTDGTRKKKIDANTVKIAKTTGFDVINTPTTNNLSNLIDVGFGDDGKNHDSRLWDFYCSRFSGRLGRLHDGTAQRLLRDVPLCSPDSLRTGCDALRDQQHFDGVVHNRYCFARDDGQRSGFFQFAMGYHLARVALWKRYDCNRSPLYNKRPIEQQK